MIVETFPLYEGLFNATLTAYIQDNQGDNLSSNQRPAIVICPGGAYMGITEKEAEPVALRFVSSGYQAFVLRYSVGAELARFPAPFLDAAKAIMMVRKNTVRWGIHPDRITLCGFSTGGQVAAILGTTWQEEYLKKALGEENHYFQPNALLLGYPLLNMEYFQSRNRDRSLEMSTLLEMMFGTVYGTSNPSQAQLEQWNPTSQMTTHMPPTFLWITSEDSLMGVDGALEFIKALARNQIPYEFHLFEKGTHGLSLADETVGYAEADKNGIRNTDKWVELALEWLKDKYH
jgi:acetyl esterase/lipase